METMQCNRCGKEFSIRIMLADISGKGLICQNCFGMVSQVRRDADKLMQKKFTEAEKVGKRAKSKEKEFAKRIKEGKEYVCKSCNYRFISAIEPKGCPYCSEMGKLIVIEKVVKEIDDIMKG